MRAQDALNAALAVNSTNASLYAERAVAKTRLSLDPLPDWRQAVQLKPNDAWLRISLAGKKRGRVMWIF